MSNFTCTELNANKLQHKTILIYIEFGTCKVRRLNWALVIFTFKLSKRTYWLHSRPISEASQHDLLTNTELRVFFPRWPSIGLKTGSSQTTSCSIQSYFSEQCMKLIEQRETLRLWDLLTSRECPGGWYESNLFALQGNVYVLKGNVYLLFLCILPPSIYGIRTISPY